MKASETTKISLNKYMLLFCKCDKIQKTKKLIKEKTFLRKDFFQSDELITIIVGKCDSNRHGNRAARAHFLD